MGMTQKEKEVNLPECPMSAIAAILFITEHFGTAGQTTDVFNQIIYDPAREYRTYYIAEIIAALDAERKERKKHVERSGT